MQSRIVYTEVKFNLQCARLSSREAGRQAMASCKFRDVNDKNIELINAHKKVSVFTCCQCVHEPFDAIENARNEIRTASPANH